MDGFKGDYITREYTCKDCNTSVRVINIPTNPKCNAKYELYCPNPACKKLIKVISYTNGDMPPRMELL